jgi:hypothetical protein
VDVTNEFDNIFGYPRSSIIVSSMVWSMEPSWMKWSILCFSPKLVRSEVGVLVYSLYITYMLLARVMDM